MSARSCAARAERRSSPRGGGAPSKSSGTAARSAAIENATSVKSGRSMRQIAEGDSPVWDSTRSKAAMKKNVAAIKTDESGKRGKHPAVI